MKGKREQVREERWVGREVEKTTMIKRREGKGKEAVMNERLATVLVHTSEQVNLTRYIPDRLL